MVFLSTTLEPERISRRAMPLRASSEAEGISRPALASGSCSTAEGISRPPLALGTTSTPDPRVNLQDASCFFQDARVDWLWFFPTLPIFEKSRWRQKRRRRNPNWNGED
jgi:hypothetical protein